MKGSLVHTWLLAEAYRFGLTQAKALRVLNAMTGGKYTASRIGEWKRGRRMVPGAVRAHMMSRCLPYALKQAGVDITHTKDETLEALAKALV